MIPAIKVYKVLEKGQPLPRHFVPVNVGKGDQDSWLAVWVADCATCHRTGYVRQRVYENGKPVLEEVVENGKTIVRPKGVDRPCDCVIRRIQDEGNKSLRGSAAAAPAEPRAPAPVAQASDRAAGARAQVAKLRAEQDAALAPIDYQIGEVARQVARLEADTDRTKEQIQIELASAGDHRASAARLREEADALDKLAAEEQLAVKRLTLRFANLISQISMERTRGSSLCRDRERVASRWERRLRAPQKTIQRLSRKSPALRLVSREDA